MMRRATISAILLAATITATANSEGNTVLQQAEAGDAEAQNTVGEWCYNGSNGMERDYVAALQWWAKAAKQGYVEAVGNMGMCYRYGHGVERDSVRAMQLYLKSIKDGNDSLFIASLDAAEQRDSLFDGVLAALCYQKGNGVKRNAQRAEQLFTLAAQNGSADAQRELALLLLNSRRETESVGWFLQAASQGDVSATYFSGMLRMDGIGIERDTIAGFAYIRKAADKGFPQALFDLSQRYASGIGVERDSTAARDCLRKAAAKGSGRAQWEYACRLRDGRDGEKQNFDMAVRWMAMSAENGYEFTFQRQYCNRNVPDSTAFFYFLKGMALMDRERFDEALKAFARVEDAGIAEGTTMRGIALIGKSMMLPELNSDSLIAEGMECLKATTDKNDLAKYSLFLLSIPADSTATEAKPDVELLEAAAANGYPLALCELGTAYYKGIYGLAQDYAKAVEYFRATDEIGMIDEESAKLYADCLRKGLGTDANPAEAKAVTERAQKNGALKKLFEPFAKTWLGEEPE